MSLFQCDNCGCIENTALSHQGFSFEECFDWAGKEHMRGWKLCSACGPSKFKDGTDSEDGGGWHGEFPRRYLPLGKFKTNDKGNLEHIETGEPPGEYILDEPPTPLEKREFGHYESFQYIESPEPVEQRVAQVGGRRRIGLATMAGVIGALAASGGQGFLEPTPDLRGRGRILPPRNRSKTLDQMDKETRDDEARMAKAETKRQRRMERNRRLAGKEK